MDRLQPRGGAASSARRAAGTGDGVRHSPRLGAGGGRSHRSAGVHGADDAPLRPPLLPGRPVGGGASRRFASCALGGPFRHRRPSQQPVHPRDGARRDVPQTQCRSVPDSRSASHELDGHLQPVTVSTAEVAVFDLFALHPFRGCDAKATVACELLDPGPHRPPALDAETLASVAMLYPPTTRQRVGFLLHEMAEHVGRDFDSTRWKRHCPARLGPWSSSTDRTAASLPSSTTAAGA